MSGFARGAWMMTRRCLLVIIAVGIAACGGGSGGGGDDAPSPPPPQTPPSGNFLPGPRPVIGPQSYVNFETAQVRPLAISADGQRLYAVNTPDGHLEVFSITSRLTLLASVPVGIDPVAVAEDPQGRVWVVNHLSDSVSIVDVAQVPPRVVQTLWVGDEPRDIVFAGAERERAFITTAHRGQNSPVDPALNTAGIGRADVWVFDSKVVDDAPGGGPLSIITLFGDRPRPLAVSADGLRVYVGIFLSGNRSTVIGPGGFDKGSPADSADGVAAPDTGLILEWDGSDWVDHRGTVRTSSVPFTLPDFDLFEIDAIGLEQSASWTGIGTVLFNIAVNPVTGKLYVSNIDSRNAVRFSGPATRASTSVRGRVADQRITVVDSVGPSPRLLNKHLDFTNPVGSPAVRELSVSTPLGMAVSGDGKMLYLAAFGSGKVTVYDTTELEDDSFAPSADRQVSVSGGGPSAVVLDEARGRAYVMTRFDNGISTLDLATQQETAHITLHSPEPVEITNGRKFLYDANLTSGNGNDSCASCHVFGDTDGLAWDLGDPDATVQAIPNTFITISPPARPFEFHPLKGPMATQSMRGLKGHGPMHWRGDRTGANRSGDETLEEAAFKEFNEAFDAFAGLDGELDEADMQAFTDFAMRISYPPNPIRQLGNQLVGIQARGEQQFLTGVVRVQTGVREVCVQCHTLDPAAGLFGTRGLMSDNSQPGERNFKIPHFRDQYQKVGMFGWGFNTPPETGPQIRGFSFNHNGATSSNFIIADLGMSQDDLLALRAYLYAFPTESPPITGQQLTVSPGNQVAARARLDLLVERALVTEPVPECDLVVHGVIGSESRGWLMTDTGDFRGDRTADPNLSQAELLALVSEPTDRLTFTCTPWGSGERIALDRDEDGVLNGDE
jgi:DNA-binding beta-propeller fold protein YncE/mono/diheme cytochrome c family protein